MLSETNTQKLEDKSQEFKSGFIELCDEFSEHNDYCAFFCESVSLHAKSGKPIDKACAQGLERFARAMRDKSQYFDNWLQELHVKI